MKPRSIEVFDVGQDDRQLVIGVQRYDPNTGLPAQPTYQQVFVKAQEEILAKMKEQSALLAAFIKWAKDQKVGIQGTPDIEIPDFIAGGQ